MKRLLFNIGAIVICQTLSCLMPLNSSAQKIAGGDNLSLALCSDSVVWTWGNNNYGQLGIGNTLSSFTPVKVNGINGIKMVAAGGTHTLFVKNDGSVWACGNNSFGQLGDGTSVSSSTPVKMSGIIGVTAIAGGTNHTLLVKNDGTLWACGWNTFGQFGNGLIANSPVPILVSSLTGIKAVAAGQAHSIFLKADSTVWTSGYNNFGQLGNGTVYNSADPIHVAGLNGISAISCGFVHSLFVRKIDGTVWACGNNGYGELGDGTTTNRSTPVQVSGLTGIIAVAGGSYHSLFLKKDGTVWACGWNNTGQLGDGTFIDRSTPVQVNGLTGIIAIAAEYGGNGHSMFLKNDGTLWVCGSNNQGQLGDGTALPHSIPEQVNGLCMITTSVDKISEPINISVFPNPIENEFTLLGTKANGIAKIFDANGIEMVHQITLNEKTYFNIMGLKSGFYLLTYSNTNIMINIKIVKY
jgi:alpha-tubulin suppressor-like RCC1 family protein